MDLELKRENEHVTIHYLLMADRCAQDPVRKLSTVTHLLAQVVNFKCLVFVIIYNNLPGNNHRNNKNSKIDSDGYEHQWG